MKTARLARDAVILERAIAALASYQHTPSVIWELERVLAVIQAELSGHPLDDQCLPIRFTDEPETTDALVGAMRTLGMDGDSIFRRIRDDLERGLAKEARSHLNFVDELLRTKAHSAWISCEQRPPVGEEYGCFFHSEDVLFTDGKNQWVGYLQTWEGEEYAPTWKMKGTDECEWDVSVVSHWMPLPSPPQHERRGPDSTEHSIALTEGAGAQPR